MTAAFKSGETTSPHRVDRLTCCTDQHADAEQSLPRSVSVLQRSSPAETTRLQLLQVFREAQLQNTLEFQKYKIRLPYDTLTEDNLSSSTTKTYSTLVDQEANLTPKPNAAVSGTAAGRVNRLCQWSNNVDSATPFGSSPANVEIDFRKYFDDQSPNAGASPNHRIGQAMSPFSFTKPVLPAPPSPLPPVHSRTPGSSLIYPANNGLVSSVSSFHYFPQPPPPPVVTSGITKPIIDLRDIFDSTSEQGSHPLPFASKDHQCRTVVAAVVKSRQGLKYRQGFLLTLRRYCPKSSEYRLLPEVDQIVLALTRNRKSKIYEIENLSTVDSSTSCMNSLKTHLGGPSEVWSDVPFEFLEKCARTLVCYFEEHSMPAVLVFASRSERDEFLFALQSLLCNVEGRKELTQFIYDDA